LNADAAILLIPYGADPLTRLAPLLLENHRDQLPDLSRQAVLFPHTSAVPRFRRILREQAAQHGYAALLPPDTGTLASWAGRFAGENKRRLSATAREIVLLDLLNDRRDGHDQYRVWPLIDSLLALFDELTLYQCQWPDDADGFIRQIARHYANGKEDFAPFDNEARLVHSLWGAWRRRLMQGNFQDQTLQLMDGLARSLELIPADTHIYLAGFTDFSRAETQWLKTLHAQRRVTLLLQGQLGDNNSGRENPVARILHELGTIPAPAPSCADAYSAFLDRAYAWTEASMLERTRRQIAAAPTSPARGRLTIHEATDAESEARAIDLQVRRWLIKGYRDIGIVTNDRKLARRVRALLERANIGLQDAGGWALSTTSAATALARWLECLEQYFSHRPLLDLLKSPFLHLGFERTEFSRLVSAFEQTVVRAQNVASGLDNYRFSLDRAAADLHEHFGADVAGTLARLLDRLENASALLTALQPAPQRPALAYLEALQQSLKILGMAESFEKDAAGRELLAVLEEMRAAATHAGLRLTWTGFHQWLKRNMEQRRFRPPMQGRGVELMGFTESRLYRFDALIIAGALREHLPGQLHAPPYFNDQVRAELGLPALARRHGLLFQDFRRLLEAAPHVVISLRREHEGERLAPSPWVEQLRAFHKLAYRDSLDDPELEWLVQQPDAVIVNRDAPLPVPVTPPAARLPAAMLPALTTATNHQQLIDCPYQFFCASGLNLMPEKEVREEIEKADFGKYVHRILQAFHAGLSGLPGPWQKPLNDDSLAEAEELLQDISQKVFTAGLRRRYLTRGWLYRWQACIPAYLEWEKDHSAGWLVQAAEVKMQRDYRDGEVHATLSGRIDRLDRGADGLRIIDYKTGIVPTISEVMSGEKIQLPFYALLLENENVTQVMFLSLQDSNVAAKSVLEGETLALLRTAVRKRLMLLKHRLDNEALLPAWGDADTCDVCDMEGLCRRGMWLDQAQKPW
jgi:ATP-dependent helicase/nuclease subunit B